MSPEEHAMLSDLLADGEATRAQTAEEWFTVGWSREMRRQRYENVARSRVVRRRSA